MARRGLPQLLGQGEAGEREVPAARPGPPGAGRPRGPGPDRRPGRGARRRVAELLHGGAPGRETGDGSPAQGRGLGGRARARPRRALPGRPGRGRMAPEARWPTFQFPWYRVIVFTLLIAALAWWIHYRDLRLVEEEPVPAPAPGIRTPEPGACRWSSSTCCRTRSREGETDPSSGCASATSPTTSSCRARRSIPTSSGRPASCARRCSRRSGEELLDLRRGPRIRTPSPARSDGRPGAPALYMAAFQLFIEAGYGKVNMAITEAKPPGRPPALTPDRVSDTLSPCLRKVQAAGPRPRRAGRAPFARPRGTEPARGGVMASPAPRWSACRPRIRPSARPPRRVRAAASRRSWSWVWPASW